MTANSMRIDYGLLAYYVVCAVIIGFVLLIVFGAWKSETDPELIAERNARQYEHNYPCINGIRYIRSGASNAQNLTPMIDPATMHPQLCGPEKSQ